MSFTQTFICVVLEIYNLYILFNLFISNYSRSYNSVSAHYHCRKERVSTVVQISPCYLTNKDRAQRSRVTDSTVYFHPENSKVWIVKREEERVKFYLINTGTLDQGRRLEVVPERQMHFPLQLLSTRRNVWSFQITLDPSEACFRQNICSHTVLFLNTELIRIISLNQFVIRPDK